MKITESLILKFLSIYEQIRDSMASIQQAPSIVHSNEQIEPKKSNFEHETKNLWFGLLTILSIPLNFRMVSFCVRSICINLFSKYLLIKVRSYCPGTSEFQRQSKLYSLYETPRINYNIGEPGFTHYRSSLK